ncbi:FtsK/SpoIIIE domain-containing protein [Ureaplasma ceti]|uniref:FtsK domain-containing protein n=1 Tax=Ureaplasma ceti TaxID=3119530 RepID=A0ABP9U5S2_9BACT
MTPDNRDLYETDSVDTNQLERSKQLNGNVFDSTTVPTNVDFDFDDFLENDSPKKEKSKKKFGSWFKKPKQTDVPQEELELPAVQDEEPKTSLEQDTVKPETEVETPTADEFDDDFNLETKQKAFKPKFNKKLFKDVSLGILQGLAITLLLLSIIRVPYLGSFIDSTIFGFLFGWARYFVYAILLIALFLLWFPKYYRKVFSKRKWLIYLAITLSLSIIMSGVGNYVMGLNKLDAYEKFYILNDDKLSWTLQNRAYITSWYLNLWDHDLVHYGQQVLIDNKTVNITYAYEISPSHFEYGGLFGIFCVSSFIYTSSAILVLLGLGIIASVITYLVFAQKRKNKVMTPLRKKIIQILGGYTEKQESEEIQKYDISEMKFSSSIHKKFNELTTEKNLQDISPEAIDNDNDELLEVDSSNNDWSVTSNLEHNANYLDNIVDNVPLKEHELLEMRQAEYFHNPKYALINQYQQKLKELPKFDYPVLGDDIISDYDPYDGHCQELTRFEKKVKAVLQELNVKEDGVIKKRILFQTAELRVIFTKILLEETQNEIFTHLNNDEEFKDRFEIRWNGESNIGTFILKLADGSKLSLEELIMSIGQEHPISMAIGKEVDRSDFWINALYEPNTIVYGGIGSGRMMLISSMITSMCFLNSPTELQGYLIDTTGKSLKSLYNLPHLIMEAATDEDSAEDVLTIVATSEIDERLSKFQEMGVDNIYEYNLKVTDTEMMPNVFVVINEVSSLLNQYPDAVTDLNRILDNAAKCGFIVIMTSANVTEEVVQFNKKMNNIIAMKLESIEESQLVLDKVTAYYLCGKGDMLLASMGKISRLQMVFADRNKTAQIIEKIQSSFKEQQTTRTLAF